MPPYILTIWFIISITTQIYGLEDISEDYVLNFLNKLIQEVEQQKRIAQIRETRPNRLLVKSIVPRDLKLDSKYYDNIKEFYKPLYRKPISYWKPDQASYAKKEYSLLDAISESLRDDYQEGNYQRVREKTSKSNNYWTKADIAKCKFCHN